MGKKRLNKNQTEEQPGLLRGRGVRPTKWRERVRASESEPATLSSACLCTDCTPVHARPREERTGEERKGCM